MLEKITNIMTVIVLLIILIFAAAIISYELKPKDKTYIYMYISEETGAYYYITATGDMIPVFNPDGSIYTGQ